MTVDEGNSFGSKVENEVVLEELQEAKRRASNFEVGGEDTA